MKKYFKVIGRMVMVWAMFLLLQYSAQAVLVGIKFTVASNNPIKNSSGGSLALGAYVQIIQSNDKVANPPLLNGSPDPNLDEVKDTGKLQSNGNFEDQANLDIGKYVYIRAWEEWDGTGLPHGKYGTSTPVIIPDDFGFVYQHADGCQTNTPIFSVTVTYPNGGEFIAGNSTQTITWTRGQTAPDHWKLSYATDTGNTWVEINASVSGNLLNYSWAVPEKNAGPNVNGGPKADGNGCLVKVEAKDSGNATQAQDTSNAFFTIDSTAPGKPENLASNPAGWTNANQNNFTLTWDPPSSPADLSGIASSQFQIGTTTRNGNATTLTVDKSYVGSGITPVSVWLVDKAGNTGSNNKETINIYPDKNPPIFSGPVNATSSTPTKNVVLSFDWSSTTASDADSGLATSNFYYYLLDNSNNATNTAVKNANNPTDSKTVSLNAAGGQDPFENWWYLHVICKDKVDNLSTVLTSTPALWVDTSPSTISFDPIDGSSNIDVQKNIVVTFDDPMDPNTVTYTLIPDPGNVTLAWNPDNTVLTISHKPFNYLTPYALSILTATNNVLLESDPAQTTFTTGPPTLPELVSNLQALSEPSEGNITLKFSNPPDAGYPMGAWAVYTTSFDTWDNLTKDSAGENIWAKEIPLASYAEDPANPAIGKTKCVLPETKQGDPALTAGQPYYFKVFTYIDSPGPRVFNLNAKTGNGVMAAAVPMQAGTKPYTLMFKPGINSFSMPFSPDADGNWYTTSNSINITIKTALDLVKALNESANATGGSSDVVTTFGIWNSDTQKAEGALVTYTVQGQPNTNADLAKDLEQGVGYQVFIGGTTPVTFGLTIVNKNPAQ